jgi:hypothetical protein
MRQPRRRGAAARVRRGSALMLVLIMTFGLAALAMSAIYLSASTGVLSRLYDREQELRYGAEAGLAMAKSHLNNDPEAMPDTGFRDITAAVGELRGADGAPLDGVTMKVYAGPTGIASREFGRFGSLIAEASDGRGGRAVRRLELAQESFARFAYFSVRETNNDRTIYFAPNDALWGPVWSNDVLHIIGWGTQKATFHGDVGTAKTIEGKRYAIFDKGYSENQKEIKLPAAQALDKLTGYASAGNLSFTAPTTGDASTVRMRLEFVPLDLNDDGRHDDQPEGFVRIYETRDVAPGGSAWLRGDFSSRSANCGDWHQTGNGTWTFFPVAVHTAAWLDDMADAIPGGGNDDEDDEDDDDNNGNNGNNGNSSIANLRRTRDSLNKYFPLEMTPGLPGVGGGQPVEAAILSNPANGGARCFPGGDPHLSPLLSHIVNDRIGGDSTTFEVGNVAQRGEWRRWAGTVPKSVEDALVAAGRNRNEAKEEARYLFPLYRSAANPGFRGVIDVKGTVAVSGRLRGRLTLHSDATIVIIDDVRYTTDPATGFCNDILGMIAEQNVVIADNALMTPQDATVGGASALWRSLDDTKDAHFQGVIMATGTSFTVERYDAGPYFATECEGSPDGRGCLYLTGGLIQDARGAVGTTAGTGFLKRYTYDKCAVKIPPPYFPTTGRFTDNRYSELDPVRFDVEKVFRSLAPPPEQ